MVNRVLVPNYENTPPQRDPDASTQFDLRADGVERMSQGIHVPRRWGAHRSIWTSGGSGVAALRSSGSIRFCNSMSTYVYIAVLATVVNKNRFF